MTTHDRGDLVAKLGGEQLAQELSLQAEGNFHFILGTKDEHDGVKVYASNPGIVEALLGNDRFRPQKYYCRLAGDEAAILEGDEVVERLADVESIDAMEGMLPYDAVRIDGADGTIDVPAHVPSAGRD